MAATRATVEERRARGKRAREAVPRRVHGEWSAATGRADPVGLLERQSAGRVPELLPIRYGRMATSPFAFFRGAAAIMAADLAPTPRSRITVQLSGDAHLSNFGGFASPDRTLVFDLNDFDETLPGPWEWDLKRLAASLAVAGREAGFGERQRGEAVRAAAAAYRGAMREFAQMRNIDVWYARVEHEDVLERVRDELGIQAARRVERGVAKARGKDSLRALAKLTTRVDGELRLISDPPLIRPVTELLPGAAASALEETVGTILRDYTASLPSHVRQVVESYRFVDLARKVVGVGSVGTRSWVALLVGRDEDDPLFLQIKEAGPSVLQAHLGRGRFANQGRRVVEGQRLMQAAGDVLLGWIRATGIDGAERDFYVRQLWDWKLSVAIEGLAAEGLAGYGRLCGWTLARAHARTGDRIAIASYIGAGDKLDRAMERFAETYADVNARDHQALVEAIRVGRVQAEEGV